MLTHTLSLVAALMVQRIAGQVGSGSCTDAIQNCAQYGQNVCTDAQYATWVGENCALYCGKCSAAPAVPSGGGGCTDAIQNCAQYGQNVCSDSQYDVWAKQNCAMTCHKCGGSSGTVVTQAPAMPVNTMAPATGGCTDTINDCNGFGQSVCSDPQYDAWARQNCAGTCNKCSGGVTPATGSQGGGFSGSSSGCAYKGQVYPQGQSWNDGCQYKCTCVDGSSGQYSCSEMCYTFNIPPICQMVGPAPGKCCQTPSCPPQVTIQYPPGYEEN